ncbi:hypothetical protein HMPREF7545_1286 [Selenomonas noxia ATCC 43541]|nr:hypothetical protein HMPREF7545_1286 [Selenomonas noxia ATCC 43541]
MKYVLMGMRITWGEENGNAAFCSFFDLCYNKKRFLVTPDS